MNFVFFFRLFVSFVARKEQRFYRRDVVLLCTKRY